MKGIILAGGNGTRLRPLTLITNKHLLPVYNKPMVLYPLETLKKCGVNEIMVVCGQEHGGHFINFLGSGKELGVKFSYAIQKGSGGIADALHLAEDFAAGEKVAVILGDNIFEEDFSKEIEEFKNESGAKVFVKKVDNPQRFGVAEIHGGRIVNIVEKPSQPKSNFATTGFYLYDGDVFDKIKKLKPSGRGELEITDVHNMYVQEGKLTYGLVRKFWSDAGTLNSLHEASSWAFKVDKENRGEV
ncbi:MAG: sugar phosphate nucleotidyltransferase [Candidatus Paceibacterota bacterium]|jgi:glucose-1-phosphate thymidylyltransferase